MKRRYEAPTIAFELIPQDLLTLPASQTTTSRNEENEEDEEGEITPGISTGKPEDGHGRGPGGSGNRARDMFGGDFEFTLDTF